MRFWLLLAFLLALFWLWRRATTNSRSTTKTATTPKPTQTQDMLRCHHCGVHIPSSEAVAGRLGSYCCAQHLQAAEAPSPPTSS